MTRRPLGFAPMPAPETQGDWDAYNDVTRAGQGRVLGAMEDRARAISRITAQRPERAPTVAQIGYNPQTKKYVVGAEEFDAFDPAVVKMFAELEDLPAQPLAPGLEPYSLDQVKERWQYLNDNAELDLSWKSRGLGMVEAIAGVPRGLAATAGFDVANPAEGIAEKWRSGPNGLNMYERVGRLQAPSESLVGFGNAIGQAVETGVPVLIAGGLGSLATPMTGLAAGAAVAGGMAAESQGDEAMLRLQQQLAQVPPEELAAQNPEYASLRRAGNGHEDSVAELVRRGRTAAARSGALVGGVSGLVAGPAGRFALRGLGLGGAGAKAGDEIGDAMLRRMRGQSTGLTGRLRGSAGMGTVGGIAEGAQEFAETDVSQAMADISAGQSDRYQFGQYGTWADFFGGVAGGGPLGALGGLRNPGPRITPPENRPTGGTGDQGLDAAMAGVAAPPGASPSGAQGGNRQMVPAPGQRPGLSGGAMRPLGTNWTGGPGPTPEVEPDIVEGEFTEVPRELPAPAMRALPAPAWAQPGPPRLEDGIAGQQRETAELEAEFGQIQNMLAQYTQAFGNSRDLPDGAMEVVNGLNDRASAIAAELDAREQAGPLPLGRMEGQTPTAPPAAYDPEVVLANAPGRPSADVLAQALQQRGAAPAPEAAPVVDDRTPQMFGPSGGVTQAAKRNDTLRESQRDIAAQIKAMVDPNAEKDSVWVAFGTRMPETALPDNVIAVPTPVGTLLTTDPTKARALRQNPRRASDSDFISQLLGYTVAKTDVAAAEAAGQPAVALEAVMPDGAVADNEVTTPQAAPTAAKRMAKRAGPAATVEAKTPEAALAGRTERVAAEAAPKPTTTPSRQPTADQTAGPVYMQIAPGGSQELRRKAIIEELARLDRKLRVTVGKSARANIETQAKMLQAQLDAIAEPAPTQAAGQGPAKGSVQEGETPKGRNRPRPASERTTKSPSEEARRVDEEAAELARQIRELESEPTLDFGSTDEDASIAPGAKPFEGVEVVGEENLTPERRRELDRARKRLENLNQLLACVLK